jgi:ABC-type bacteriocin/lantibiotic exporter with double-glycine peptidase domain
VRRQRDDHDCGPTALANALERFGLRRGLSAVAKACGTTLEGSDEGDLTRGALALGCGADPFACDDPRAALTWLLASLKAGRPALLCVDRWGHWITALGACGRDVVIYDPARETGGTFVLRWRSLRRRWETARRARRSDPRFYALAVSHPEVSAETIPPPSGILGKS